MKTKIKTTKEVEVKYLIVDAGVRYWEDATVNGVEDVSGDLIPGKKGERWQVSIDVESGVIQEWPKGTTAEIHYKICDDGIYALEDAGGHTITEIDGYVPDTLCPKDNGYGDYIIMDVDADGKIKDWKFSAKDFERSED